MLRYDDIDGVFTNSCIPFDLPCALGTYYINPCDCTSYYQCHQSYRPPLLRHCGPGTAWDDTIINCNDKNLIHQANICSLDKPWQRCSRIFKELTDDDIDNLRHHCLSENSTPSGLTGSGDNTGAIVGGVVGSIIIILLVILLLYYLRSKGFFMMGLPKGLRRPSHPDFKTSVNNPGYSVTDEEYATIDDIMDDPSYNSSDERRSNIKPPVPKRPLKTLSIPDIITSSETSTSDQNDHNKQNGLKQSYYSPFIERQDLKHVPSGYSTPYLLEGSVAATVPTPETTEREPIGKSPVDPSERPRLPEPVNLKSKKPSVANEMSIPDYVDFGEMDGDYNLPTTPARFYIGRIENK
ncbi:uncharacterized protein LOC126826956 [Patella vulgata]|uniref:uncharacterized protein LOC126826956 n=1 Tax=Patella vulgata TaxID=6465 RepID=UPI0021809AC9|nr:uncharacterized protein LOC126826956 [Patella vulgata]